MQQYKRDFIDFMLESKVLKFGKFTLKSGRKSPFFMNAGDYVTGKQLEKLGEFYAIAIKEKFGLDFDILFGPAYKGIPLSVATAMAIYKLYGKEVRYCANRKEIKDHGDAGILLGAKIQDGDRIVMIEDVTTSGDVEIIGLMVSLNRQEKGKGGSFTAIDEVSMNYEFPAEAIVNMDEVIKYIRSVETYKEILNDEVLSTLEDYYREYGVK